MTTKKKFDLTTLVVILISAGLILTGMYFLNQTTKKINQSKAPTKAIDKTDYSTLSSSSLAESSSQSSELASSSIQSSSANSSVRTLSSSSSSSSSTAASSTSSSNTLNGNEAKVKVIEINGGSNYLVKVIDTGIKDAKFFGKDKDVKIFSTQPLSKDKLYTIGGLSETATSYEFESINE